MTIKEWIARKDDPEKWLNQEYSPISFLVGMSW